MITHITESATPKQVKFTATEKREQAKRQAVFGAKLAKILAMPRKK